MVLTLRDELICFVLLIILWYSPSKLQIVKNSKTFSRLSFFALIHVLFAAVSVFAANNEIFPYVFKIAFHVFFYLTAILYEKELFQFVVKKCYPEKTDLSYNIGFAVVLLYLVFSVALCIFPFGIEPITFRQLENAFFYGSGPITSAGHLIALIYYIFAICMLITRRKELGKNYSVSILPFILILIVFGTIQAVYRPFLFTCGVITAETFVFFLFFENPIYSFEKELLTDTMTGMGSRHGYENEIEKLEKKYRKDPSETYLFAFCDINRLRNVNNLYGHREGDDYISLVASELADCLKNAYGIYRIGGDEFIAIYVGVSEETAVAELNTVSENLKAKSGDYEYEPSVSIGYATSEKNFKTLKEVIQAADYAMYAVKNRVESGDFYDSPRKLNFNTSGLTDKFFDALCMSKDFKYLFVSNLETQVTRVSPALQKDFGFESEFMNDFLEIWTPKLHPDDRQAFLDTIFSITKGENAYTDIAFSALTYKDEYAKCVCHAFFMRGDVEKADLILGYMKVLDTL
ncbi:MAG: GGDEF domain-containing protein [Clostridiales bacterium]|nr:GGDEF domain-containing protein [Clostridiales bacterium]